MERKNINKKLKAPIHIVSGATSSPISPHHMTDADAGYVQDLLENVSVYFENIKNITPIQKKSRKFNTQLFPSPMTDINHRLSATSASVSQLSANDYLSIQNRSVEKT